MQIYPFRLQLLGHTALSLPPSPRPIWWPWLLLPPSNSAPPYCPFRRVPAPATPPSHHAPPLTSSLLRHSSLATPPSPPPSSAPAYRLRPRLLLAPPQGPAPLLPRWGPPGVVEGPGAQSGPASQDRHCGTAPLFSRPGAAAPFLRVSCLPPRSGALGAGGGGGQKNSNDKTRRYFGTLKVLLGAHLQFAKSLGPKSGCEWARVGSVSERERVGARSSVSPIVFIVPAPHCGSWFRCWGSTAWAPALILSPHPSLSSLAKCPVLSVTNLKR